MLVFLVVCVCSVCLMCLLHYEKGKPQIGIIRHAFSTPFIVCVYMCVFSWNLSVCL